MLVKSNNLFLTVSFVMCWYFTLDILMHNMRQMLQCRNISRLFRRDIRSAESSHPHSNRLTGMARKIRYLLRLTTLVSVQNVARAPIDEFPASRRVSML